MPINVRRLIDWLMCEHLSKVGKENGNLKAPYRQLYAFGIGARYAVDAIAGAEERGLVRCYRPGRRMMTTFALTWLPLRDGSGPTDDWRAYRDSSLMPLKNRNLHVKGNADRPKICMSKGMRFLEVLTREERLSLTVESKTEGGERAA